MKVGLDFDLNIRKKHPDVDDSLAKNNEGMCPVFFVEFDEEDPTMKAFSLSCGHQFSYAAWESYLREKVTDKGPNTVFTTCQ